MFVYNIDALSTVHTNYMGQLLYLKLFDITQTRRT